MDVAGLLTGNLRRTMPSKRILVVIVKTGIEFAPSISIVSPG